ncbi:hypothetical protein HD806DRAFT_548221 [Xylariaceae sp. AK1471]|nr:hypothetical protein HD806DRAFT_548221 [Xylariaceae sp. AK1471]
MEQHRFPRRSASHGTLRSSYSSHGGLGVGPSPLRPLHKPLRCVNENSVLLHSPGALESMLKTTTETGDIGIFSIKPVPPSPLSRSTLSDIGHPHPRARRSVDNLYRQNLATRPSFNRDTTSEVFSIYGSDSLKSGTSTLSPYSTDDLGQRSYSMTTCGSRHLSHHRSTNTLQSQASGGSHLQRPRSPFPYPTRLKRPGVRPASPAVTENGLVDYSRMVEIDRVSYRTVHGHFKHAYSPMPRRPRPLGLRPEANRSTSSLAPPGPPPNFRGPPRPPSVRTYSPVSVASCNPPFRDIADSPSTRTSSITSVANTYHRMPPVIRASQSGPAEPPPRYYDYTEDFENRPARLVPSIQTFAPLPRRTIKYPQAMMLREDDDNLATRHLAAVFGEGDSAFFDSESQITDEQDALPGLATAPDRTESRVETSACPSSCRRPDSASSQNSTMELETPEICSRNARSSDIDLLPSQMRRDSIDTFNPSLDLESRGAPPSYNYVTYHANTTPKTKTKSLERHVQVLGGRTPTIRSEQGVILRDDGDDETTSRETAESCWSLTETGENVSRLPNQAAESPVNKEPMSHEIFHEARSASVEDGPRYNEPPPNHVESLEPMTGLDSPKSGGSVSPFVVEETVTINSRVVKHKGLISGNNEHETNPYQQFRHHRRNHAALRISTTDLPRDDNEGHPHITPTCSSVPLISPKPISPARQLKVKNSIPQLMKALPPLPGILGYDLPSTTTDAPEEDEFADILIPFNFHGLAVPLQLGRREATGSRPMMGGGMAPSPQRDGPKFRLKIKTASCSETSESLTPKQPFRVDGNAPYSDRVSMADTGDELRDSHMRSHTRNKLKIRSPRRSRLSSPHSSTVRHNPGVEASQIVTNLLRQKPQDLFSMPPTSEQMLLRKRRKPPSQLTRSQALTASSASDFFPYERVVPAGYQVHSTLSSRDNEVAPISRDTLINSIPRHGLIKRLSNLRALLSSSSASAAPVQDTESLKTHKVTTNAPSNASFEKNLIKLTETPAMEATQLRLGQRLRAKLSRWVKGAETAMRKCANKKHNCDEQHEAEQT